MRENTIMEEDHKTKKTKKIMIVEDDMTLVHSIAFTLKRHGYTVTAISSAREALQAISAQKGEQATDLLITDIQLPDMSGRELISELVKRKALPQTLVITAYATSVLLDELKQMGVREFLAKPFDIKEITKRVSALFAAL